jgi:hypothetical protein
LSTTDVATVAGGLLGEAEKWIKGKAVLMFHVLEARDFFGEGAEAQHAQLGCVSLRLLKLVERGEVLFNDGCLTRVTTGPMNSASLLTNGSGQLAITKPARFLTFDAPDDRRDRAIAAFLVVTIDTEEG